MKKLIVLIALMVSIYGYSQPVGATKETVWEEFRVDSTFTVMFQWKGMQLAKERVELKYALSTIDINETFINSLQESNRLYRFQIDALKAVNEESEIDAVISDKINESLQGDLDLTAKQLRKEKRKKWVIGGTVVVGAAAILYLVK